MGKFTKRKKSFYMGAKKRQRVECIVGTVGYLGTCNSYEDKAVREAYDLLNRYANKLYGEEDIKKSTADVPSGDTPLPDASEDEADDLDVESALQKEVSSLQAPAKSSGIARPLRRFQAVHCTTNNNVYFRTTLADPLPTLLMAMDDILDTKQQHTKHLVRLLPVHTVCKAYIEKIEKAFSNLVSERLNGHQKSVYLAFKITSNNSISKDELLGVALKVLQELAPECKPVLTKDADITINFTVVATNCYIGEAPLFLSKYKRYNLAELANPNTTTSVPPTDLIIKESDSEGLANSKDKDNSTLNVPPTTFEVEKESESVTPDTGKKDSVDSVIPSVQTECKEVKESIELNASRETNVESCATVDESGSLDAGDTL